jgi:hypothetical protein
MNRRISVCGSAKFRKSLAGFAKVGLDFRMAENATGPSPPPTPHQAWARTTLWVLVVLIFAVNTVIVFRSCRNLPGETLDKTGKVISKAGRALSDIASAFRQGRVSTEFISYATTLSNQHYLQFATLKQTEIFTRKDESTTGFGYIPLPEVVVEARAPVEFTYYLDLNESWEFVLKDNVVYVFAPAIRFNKPAVDASAITYEVKKGYFKTAEAQENLKKSLTSLVALKAKENVALVRETGRKQVSDFVENWLMRSFSDGRQHTVKVYFANEKPPEGIQRRATLQTPAVAPQ